MATDTQKMKIQPLQINGVQQEDRKINDIIEKYSVQIGMALARVFVDEAAKFTPPNMGKSYIDNRLYYRPVQDLQKLKNGEYPPWKITKADLRAMHQGYKFRVLNTRVGHKKNEVYAYTKGINEAKRVSRIKNRGLLRYVWGDALINNSEELKRKVKENPGEPYHFYNTDLPPQFQRLARKSPSITKIHFANIQIDNNLPDGIRIDIDNRIAHGEGFYSIAMKRGAMKAQMWMRRLFNNIKNGAEDKVMKALGQYSVWEVTIDI